MSRSECREGPRAIGGWHAAVPARRHGCCPDSYPDRRGRPERLSAVGADAEWSADCWRCELGPDTGPCVHASRADADGLVQHMGATPADEDLRLPQPGRPPRSGMHPGCG